MSDGHAAGLRDRREDPEDGARHGIEAPRGLGGPPGARGARFTSMFPFLAPCRAGLGAIEALARRLAAAATGSGTAGSAGSSGPSKDIRAGHTYLGQFIDHDITFDATSKLDRDNDPHALVNFRTPRLDLDSLYGTGPADQPFLYDWSHGPGRGVTLLVGRNPDDGCSARVDLPRNAQARALIGDARNDEHLIVSQLHLLFIRFHNRVVGHLTERDPQLTGNALFDAAHRTVRWHYQWIVVHDFLRTILSEDLWQAASARLARRPGALDARCDPAMLAGGGTSALPVEFSAAAYRFGHSLVRSSYQLTVASSDPVAILPDPERPDAPHLGGFRRLPHDLQIDWARFFGATAQPSMRIDHRLSPVLFTLPPDNVSLALLNLRRGHRLCLPSGGDVAMALGHPKLTESQLFPGDLWPPDVRPAEREEILQSPPLWFYVVREAARLGDSGNELGPVGGRIVAETLVGLLEADPESYVHQSGWTPTLCDGRWNTMEDLVRFTLAGGEDGHHEIARDSP
jgi:hypothetical protein